MIKIHVHRIQIVHQKLALMENVHFVAVNQVNFVMVLLVLQTQTVQQIIV